MTNIKPKIIAEKNVFHDNILDIMGAEFKFDHEKGLAEWVKNSADAYIRTEIPDADQNIIIRLIQDPKKDTVFEVIDFVGMGQVDIDKAFKQWGDPEAAKRGHNRQVYGGHGNGGKFYMRQMFEESYFITYKDSFINVFGFNKNKRYGFDDKFKNKKVKPEEALKIAGIEKITFPGNSREKILSGKTGFTVIHGIKPSGITSRTKLGKLIERFKNHPQARLIVSRINVWLEYGNIGEYSKLEPDKIKPLTGFDIPRVIEIPHTLKVTGDNDNLDIEMSNKKYSPGRLILKTSEEAFGKGSRAADFNRIDIIGELGVIASYQLYEIDVKIFPQASFIYGECVCPILEDPEMNSVKNDRTRLHENPRSKALISWIREQVDSMANEIAMKERREQDSRRKKISAAYNDYLNNWKDRFMAKIMGDIFGTGEGAKDDNKGGTGGSTRKKVLQVPINGFDFSYTATDIVIGEIKQLTLKALVPKPIPMGSIISLKSTNTNIGLVEDSITITSETIRVIPTGETIAVINISVIGKKVGERGSIVASVGKHVAEIAVFVTEGSNEEKKKMARSPRVLLSSTSPDPLGIDPGGTVTLTERDPVVYQRPQDVGEGIYWINTQSPMGSAILDRYGENSIRWRDFIFQRYVDIFVKQALYELQNKDPEGFRAERIDSDIFDVLIRRVHTSALKDLDSFFFKEDFNPLEQLGNDK